MRRTLAVRSRTPVVVGALIATPLYFLSLMAVSLATERADIEAQWYTGKTHKLVTIYGPPPAAEEAKIWLWALVPSAIVILVGLVATVVPYGVILASLAGIGVILAIDSQVDSWAAHHTERYRFGADLLPDSSTSSNLLRGEWEDLTVEAIESMSRWIIGLAIGAIVVAVILEVRRRRGRRPATSELVDAASGQAEVSPILEP